MAQPKRKPSPQRAVAQRELVRDLLEALQELGESHPVSIAGRGNGYLSRVSDFAWHPRRRELECNVQGTAALPYIVTIELATDLHDIISVDCTCPYGESWALCKHTYAACRKLEERLSIPGDAVRRWLTGDEAVEPWMELLGRLDEFAQRQEAVRLRMTPDEKRRMAWRVDFRESKSGEVLALAPYEQKLSKTGKWTSGRKVRWERIAAEPELWTTPADQRIAEYLQQHVDGGGMYGSYFAYGFEPDLITVLGILADHPRVVWADAPQEAVEICEGKAGVCVQHVKKGLTVVPAIDGRPASDAGVCIVLESSPWDPQRMREGLICVDRDGGRVVVVATDADTIQLFNDLVQVNEPIPTKAHDQLLPRLAKLESELQLPVAYDEKLVGGTIDGDKTIFLRLEPVEPSGLFAEIKVRPSENGPALDPGNGPAEMTTMQDSKRIVVCRDLPDEIARAERIRDLLRLAQQPETRPWRWQIYTDDEALDLVAEANDYEGNDLLVEWPEDARISVSREITSQQLRVEIEDKQDWFGLNGTIDVDGEQIPLAKLLEAIRSGRRYVAIGKNQFLRIAKAFRDRLAALADVTHSSRSGLEIDVTAAPVLDDLVDSQVQLKASRSWKQMMQRLEAAAELNPDPPITLAAELRDYQLEGYRWMRRLATWGVGGCLADDMGLGKTVQALALLIDRMEEGPALVVAPTSVGFNWVREAERFAPTLRPILYRETDRSSMLESLGEGDLVVISYGLLMRDAERLAKVKWGTFVLDEAQQIKNSQTKTARAARTLDAKWRLALTGTPIENHLGELWSLFRAISPGLFGSWDRFRERFAEPIEKQKDAHRRQALSRIVRPFILRRTKAEVLDELPARTEVQLQAEMSPAESKLYEETRLKAAMTLTGLDDDDNAPRDKRFRVLAALTKLRQLACHPKLVDAKWKHSSAKLDLFLETVEEMREGNHRALVFSQFTQHLEILREALDERKIPYLYLDGQTPAKQRAARVDDFQRGEGDLFLISLKAGGTGLNLTAADYVIHMDPWWNPAVEDQATDRAHRMGQTRPVTVYRLVSKDTIEEQILALHANKRDLVAGILDGTDKAGKLSTDELIAMIRGDGPVPAATQTESNGKGPAMKKPVPAPKSRARKKAATRKTKRRVTSRK